MRQLPGMRFHSPSHDVRLTTRLLCQSAVAAYWTPRLTPDPLCTKGLLLDTGLAGGGNQPQVEAFCDFARWRERWMAPCSHLVRTDCYWHPVPLFAPPCSRTKFPFVLVLSAAVLVIVIDVSFLRCDRDE